MSSQTQEDSGRRGRGRPPTYVFSGDEELSESMEKLKLAIERRRKSQKAKYHQNKSKESKSQTRTSNDIDQQAHGSQDVEDGSWILDIALSGTSEGSPRNQSQKEYSSEEV